MYKLLTLVLGHGPFGGEQGLVRYQNDVIITLWAMIPILHRYSLALKLHSSPIKSCDFQVFFNKLVAISVSFKPKQTIKNNTIDKESMILNYYHSTFINHYKNHPTSSPDYTVFVKIKK